MDRRSSRRHHPYSPENRRTIFRQRSSDRRPSPPPPPPPQSSSNTTTFFQILCPDSKVGSIIGKNGTIITNFRRETGAWINVHQLIPGDQERIIETSDNKKREPDGRPPVHSPAQEALFMVHERILNSDFGEVEFGEEYYGRGRSGGGGDGGKVTTRLVVPRLHVGCLMGKHGKIIEMMRIETQAHIRILARDDSTPQCVKMNEEIVQIVGEISCVKNAVSVISDRLKESIHRDRGSFQRHIPRNDFFPHNNDFSSHNHSAIEGVESESHSSGGQNRPRYAFDSDPMNDQTQSLSYNALVFRILCPNNKVEDMVGSSDGTIEMIRSDIGVDVRVDDPTPGSSECIIVITSQEGPNDELFPAQEALLHIQARIVNLGPDKDNIIATRLLIPANEIGFLDGKDGFLSDIQKTTNANVQILPKEDRPPCALEADELIQIVGEIKGARRALIQLTTKLRSYLYSDISNRDNSAPKNTRQLPVSASTNAVNSTVNEPNSVRSSPREATQCNGFPTSVGQNNQSAALTWESKDNVDSSSTSYEHKDDNVNDEVKQGTLKKFPVSLVTRSILEVVIPPYAVESLLMKSGSKLVQIGQMSGATVKLSDDQPDETEKVVRISGTPEQAEKAQMLLQGFILSTQDDATSS
nr:RNA-binding KH domain-containing protein RCF3 [Allium cepa]UPW27178.1 RNA-binding KH domain-containing protein RCF3 [Allium cepa]